MVHARCVRRSGVGAGTRPRPRAADAHGARARLVWTRDSTRLSATGQSGRPARGRHCADTDPRELVRADRIPHYPRRAGTERGRPALYATRQPAPGPRDGRDVRPGRRGDHRPHHAIPPDGRTRGADADVPRDRRRSRGPADASRHRPRRPISVVQGRDRRSDRSGKNRGAGDLARSCFAVRRGTGGRGDGPSPSDPLRDARRRRAVRRPARRPRRGVAPRVGSLGRHHP